MIRKLTLGIPSLNRIVNLKQTLTCLLETVNMSYLSRRIEILVSLNNYNFKDYYKLKKEYPLVRFINTEKLLSFNENISFVFENAKNDYVWLMSDDDDYSGIDINQVLNLINLEPSYIFLNYKINSDGKLKKSRFLPFFRKLNKALSINFANTFISSNIFSKKLFIKYSLRISPSSNFVHLEVANTIIDNYANIIIIDDSPVIMMSPSYSESRKHHGIDFYFNAFEGSLNIAKKRKNYFIRQCNYFVISNYLCWEVANLISLKKDLKGSLKLTLFYLKHIDITTRFILPLRLPQLIIYFISINLKK